ncbi:hypothetical protein [Pseudomonas wadenswilerensis]|uniref:hypothetical protein n=1 Tax=Pseudomonas wadenswilerensis TaxID=1785161 RepID=UPI000E0F0FEB|nr:hypothetical protein [Pseudomonas wadenswilerensis]
MLEDDGKDGKTTRIREGCRELRQFLSSLVGIRWPDSLQSLLLLSEDPISRKFGAGTSVIYGLLMSGDTKGIVEHLSPRADKIVLNDDQAHLLHQMVSDLHLESVSRRHNALRVLANLMGDLPQRTVRLVLGPLCTELAASSDLRSMIGVSKIASVLKSANRDDQRQVAAALVADVCTVDKQFGLSLENMQTPSLDDAKSMAAGAVEIILPVREEHGLSATQDRTFVKWLQERNITVAGVSYSFPFSTLESWIVSHETMLMKTLGVDYVTLLGIEVEAGRGKDIDMKRAASRVTAQFEEMAQAGEESRAELWQIIGGYLTLPEVELSACAFAVIEQHQKLMSSEALLICMSIVIDLLIKHPEPEIDFDRGFKWLMQCASSRFDELDDEVKARLAALAQNLAGEHYADYAVPLYEGVIRRDGSLLATVSESWAESLAQKLPLKCCEAMFRCYDRLPVAVKAAIANFLETGSTGAPLSPRFSQIYQQVAMLIPERYWKEPELQAHLNAVLSRLPTFLNRGDEDLKAILPSLSQIYLFGDPATVGACLRDTFKTANSYPALLNLLHQFFATTWPTAENAPGYTPLSIFNDAISTMTSYPAEAKSGVLRSLQSMIDDGIVDSAQQSVLTSLACAVWQTHAAEAETFLVNCKATFTGAQVAALPDTIQWSSDEEIARLEKVWGNLATKLTAVEQVGATYLILGKGQLRRSNLPDQCLTLWTRSLGKQAFQIVKQALLAGAVADDGRRRLWRQITSLAERPNDLELLEVAVLLLELADAPETGSAVITDLKQIAERFSDQAQRYDIAKVLLLHLPRCASMAVKAHLAVLAYQLGSSAVLKTVDAASLGESDLKVIADKFGKSRELTSLRKRFEKLNV